MGYSVFALHQLQPTPKKWDLARLREFSSSQDVNNLDPYLSRLIVAYINGEIDRISGFNITDSMKSSRQAKQGQIATWFFPALWMDCFLDRGARD